MPDMKSSIVVVGSSNTDMVIKAQHLPAPGETILGGTFFMNQTFRKDRYGQNKTYP